MDLLLSDCRFITTVFLSLIISIQNYLFKKEINATNVAIKSEWNTNFKFYTESG